MFLFIVSVSASFSTYFLLCVTFVYYLVVFTTSILSLCLLLHFVCSISPLLICFLTILADHLHFDTCIFDYDHCTRGSVVCCNFTRYFRYFSQYSCGWSVWYVTWPNFQFEAPYSVNWLVTGTYERYDLDRCVEENKPWMSTNVYCFLKQLFTTARGC